MRDEDHGHVRSENNRRRSEDVGFGWVGRRRPGFVNASRMQRKCTGTHRYARVDANNTRKKVEQTGTWVHQVAQAMEEELMTREKRKREKATQRIRCIVHENDRNKKTSLARDQMKQLLRHDLLTPKAGGLTPLRQSQAG